MKKQRKIRLSALKNRMVFRLWAFMMIPVMFGIGFMWVVQIFLFEQNYANAAVNEALNRLSPVMEDLRTRDIGEDEKLLSFISHIGGELLLVSEDGTLIKMYSSGHLVQPQEWESKLNDPEMTARNLISGSCWPAAPTGTLSGCTERSSAMSLVSRSPATENITI